MRPLLDRTIEQRVQAHLAKEGVELAAEELGFAADLVRLTRGVFNLAALDDGLRRILDETLSERTHPRLLPTIEAEVFGNPRAAPPKVGEVWAFESRFGEIAANLLREEVARERDLPAFAAAHGPAGALDLLSVLIRTAAHLGPIDEAMVERLGTAARELGVDPLLLGALLARFDEALANPSFRVPLEQKRFVVGRSSGCDLRLNDPGVAPRHLELLQVANGWRVVDLGSGRPTLVNGSPVTSAPLDQNTPLQVSHYWLRLQPGVNGGPDELEIKGGRSFTALSIRNVSRKIGDTPLLDGVSFTVFAGEVVALVGPSGAGKTTLLNAINGVAPADTGTVELDGADFHRLLAADPSLVGIVPQDDLILPELTVEESLRAAGRLRFPGSTTQAELEKEVDRVLSELDIQRIRANRIGDALKRGISGGQRKRVNLGQELLRQSTRVLFLDEPTSGLDPRASQDIVRLIRQIADRGRIVFLVTHDLTPEVLAQVDHLLVLARGGRLAWFGPPNEAARYFGVETPDAIFNRIGDRTPTEWSERFQASTAWRTWVGVRERLLPNRENAAQRNNRASRPGMFHQLRTLVGRYLRVRLRDRTGMAVLAVQPVILALVIWAVFVAPTTQLLFMVSLSCLWFGMSASVRELIADRVLWRQERRVGVRVLPYIGSKVLVLGVITALQCAFLAAFVHLVLDMGSYGFGLPQTIGITVLTGQVGMTVGLLISAFFRSSEAAVGTLPLLLIPQISFSSIMVSIRDMGMVGRAATYLTLERYAFDALIKCGKELAVPTYRAGEFDRQPINGSLWKLGLKLSDAANEQGFSLFALSAILSGTATSLLILTLILVWRDREGSRG